MKQNLQVLCSKHHKTSRFGDYAHVFSIPQEAVVLLEAKQMLELKVDALTLAV